MSVFYVVMEELREKLEKEELASRDSDNQMSQETRDFLLENLPAATTLYIMNMAKCCISAASVVENDLNVLELNEKYKGYGEYLKPWWSKSKEAHRVDVNQRVSYKDPNLTAFFEKYNIEVPICMADLERVFKEFGCFGIFTEFGANGQFVTEEKKGIFPTRDVWGPKLYDVGSYIWNPMEKEIRWARDLFGDGYEGTKPDGGEILLSELDYLFSKCLWERDKLIVKLSSSSLRANDIYGWVNEVNLGNRIGTDASTKIIGIYSLMQMLVFYSYGKIFPNGRAPISAEDAFYELSFLKVLAVLPEELRSVLKIINKDHPALRVRSG